jgi:hypothetical protein
VALSEPEVEFVNSPTAVEPGTRHGTNEVLAAARMQSEILRDGRFEIDRTYGRGEEVIVVGRLSRLMPDGDARIEDRFLGSCTIPRLLHDPREKFVRAEVLGFGKAEVERALEAARLSEQLKSSASDEERNVARVHGKRSVRRYSTPDVAGERRDRAGGLPSIPGRGRGEVSPAGQSRGRFPRHRRRSSRGPDTVIVQGSTFASH